MRLVRQIMGMPISIDIPGYDGSAVFDEVFERLRAIDARFSTYKPDSEVSRYAKGEIAEKNLSDELKKLLKPAGRPRIGPMATFWPGPPAPLTLLVMSKA